MARVDDLYALAINHINDTEEENAIVKSVIPEDERWLKFFGE